MAAVDTPASCCTTSKPGLFAAPNDCGLSGGIKGPVPIVLARDACGDWQQEDTPCVTVSIGPSFCCDDMFCSCCFAGPVPMCPGIWGRDFTCTCKTTNGFTNQGHYYTFHDKDTMFYHYLCCAAAKYNRVSAKVTPTP